jgi:hypothetical protein
MSPERKLADVLTDLSAELLAGDPSDKEMIVQAGSTLENAMAAAPEAPPKVFELLSMVLESIQSLYVESVPNVTDAMDVVIAAVAAAGECLEDPDDH